MASAYRAFTPYCERAFLRSPTPAASRVRGSPCSGPGRSLTPPATDEHDRVLLKVVPLAGDVGVDLHAVGEPDAGDLAQRRVRLLRRGRLHARADAAPLRSGDLLLATLPDFRPRCVELLLRARYALCGSAGWWSACGRSVAGRRFDSMAPNPLKRLTRLRRRPFRARADRSGGGHRRALLSWAALAGARRRRHRPPELIGSGRGQACADRARVAAATNEDDNRLRREADTVSITAARRGKDGPGKRDRQALSTHSRAWLGRASTERAPDGRGRASCVLAPLERSGCPRAALTAAYHAALTAARPEARAQAVAQLARLVARVRPASLAGAQRKVDRGAQAAAAAAPLALERRAAADAASKARSQAAVGRGHARKQSGNRRLRALPRPGRSPRPPPRPPVGR